MTLEVRLDREKFCPGPGAVRRSLVPQEADFGLQTGVVVLAHHVDYVPVADLDPGGQVEPGAAGLQPAAICRSLFTEGTGFDLQTDPEVLPHHGRGVPVGDVEQEGRIGPGCSTKVCLLPVALLLLGPVHFVDIVLASNFFGLPSLMWSPIG